MRTVAGSAQVGLIPSQINDPKGGPKPINASGDRGVEACGELEDPAAGEWVRTFTVITAPSYELMTQINDRMPAILRPADYQRWLSTEPDPHDLRITFPAEPMKMRPVSKRVNSPRNDDEGTH